MNVPSAKIFLTVTAAFPQQELITVITHPSFWEGRMHSTPQLTFNCLLLAHRLHHWLIDRCVVKGTYDGKPVTGVGFLERSGFQNIASFDDFFKRGAIKQAACWFLVLESEVDWFLLVVAVSKLTLKFVRESLPVAPTFDQVPHLCTSFKQQHINNPNLITLVHSLTRMHCSRSNCSQPSRASRFWMTSTSKHSRTPSSNPSGLVMSLCVDCLMVVSLLNCLASNREIVDRGGKTWRSFCFLLCIDAVGGYSPE